MDRLVVPQGEFDLARYPPRLHENLRAFDAADALLLDHLAGDESVDLTGSVVVVNDAFGALGVALASHHPTLVSDSYLAARGTRENLVRNGHEPGAVVTNAGSDHPIDTVDTIDVLLVKVPRSLALLDDQLARLAPSLHAGSIVIASGMTRHIHTSTLQLFERHIGPTRTSLAQKKARLIFSTPGPKEAAADRPPTTATYRLAGAGQAVTVVSLPGVFSGDRLDQGTELLLAHIPEALSQSSDDESGIASIIDLGCGNGVVGVVAAALHPQAQVTFIDESYRAVASARATALASLGDERTETDTRFVAGNGIFDLADGEPIEPGSVDLVLNNPPFHTNNALSDAIAWSMFADARVALRPGGELWVVGNRHLAYHAKLKRLFGNCDVIASNAKFVLLRAVRK